MCPIRACCAILTPVVGICSFLTNRIYVGGRRFVKIDDVQVVGLSYIECDGGFVGQVLDDAFCCGVECAAR